MRATIAAVFMLFAATVAASAQSAPPPDVLADLAPGGKLRAAINFGNSVLAQKDAAGNPTGITPDLARELGRRLGVPVELVPFEAAGKVFDAAPTGAWDIGFVAVEPVRAAVIEFSAPYVIIEGTYMVPKDSPLKAIADVDRPGVRIAVGLKSAYDLYLTRSIKNATIVRASEGGGRAMIELFVKDKLEVAAGVRQPLEAYAKSHPEVRVMDGHFMEIQQAMGTPKGACRRRALSARLRRGCEGVGLRRRGDQARGPVGGGGATGAIARPGETISREPRSASAGDTLARMLAPPLRRPLEIAGP